jgi:hypothetical protein
MEGNEKNALDLTVTIYNINKGRNRELLERSGHLAGYAEFVAEVRGNERTMPLAPAVAAAIRRCVKDGILADFFKEHGSEVMNMLLEEWNLDEAQEAWFEEGWEKGREEGRNQILELIKQGYTTEQIASKLTGYDQNRRQ